jgi:hypothetical protein
MNTQDPATKHDLELLRQAIEQKIDQRSEQLVDSMRDMQTEVLRAFHNWARPADIKLRSHEERIALLEERITEIERGRGPTQQ